MTYDYASLPHPLLCKKSDLPHLIIHPCMQWSGV